MKTIGFVGSGNMAEALIKGIISAGIYKPEHILISDVRAERLKQLARKYKVKPVKSNSELARKADTVVLSVKPQNMAEALESIKGELKKNALVISIAAGVKVATIARAIGDFPIIRAMPNTPALIGEGASALFANNKAKPMLDGGKVHILSGWTGSCRCERKAHRCCYGYKRERAGILLSIYGAFDEGSRQTRST